MCVSRQMMQQKARPMSRLGGDSNRNEGLLVAAGIPEKLISFSKPFPNVEEEGDKENAPLMAPKKQQKSHIKQANKQNEHLFRRKAHSDISNIMGRLQSKLKEQKSPQDNTKLSNHLDLPLECPKPYSQNLRTTQEKSVKQGPSLVAEEKSFARRVRERIEAESARKDEKKRKMTIGEDAYLPYPLKELKQKIAERSRKGSYEENKNILIF